MVSKESTLLKYKRKGHTVDTDIDEMNDIQNFKAQRYLKQYPDAVAGKINWHTVEQNGYKRLVDQLPIENFELDFAIPGGDRTLLKLLIEYNDAPFDNGHSVIEKLDVILKRIDEIKGVNFYWL